MAKRQDDDKDANDVTRSFRLPRDLYDRASVAAGADDRTLNSYLVRALREKLDRDEESKKRR